MIVAVSPIVGGAPIKGPADKLMSGLGIPVSATGVASCYRDFLDVMIIDEQDAPLAQEIEDLGIPTIVTDTIMRDLDAKTALARRALQAACPPNAPSHPRNLLRPARSKVPMPGALQDARHSGQCSRKAESETQDAARTIPVAANNPPPAGLQ